MNMKNREMSKIVRTSSAIFFPFCLVFGFYEAD